MVVVIAWSGSTANRAVMEGESLLCVLELCDGGGVCDAAPW